MESGVTLSFRFPTVPGQKKMEKIEERKICDLQSKSTIVKRNTTALETTTTTTNTKTVFLPSLSETLPARIYRKSTRLHDKMFQKQFEKELLIQKDGNNNNNTQQSHTTSSATDRKGIRHSSQTGQHNKKTTKDQDAKNKRAIQTQETTRKDNTNNSHFQKSPQVLNSTNQCYAFLQNNEMDSSDLILSKMEAKRMTSTEKCKKWMKKHFIDGQTTLAAEESCSDTKGDYTSNAEIELTITWDINDQT